MTIYDSKYHSAGLKSLGILITGFLMAFIVWMSEPDHNRIFSEMNPFYAAARYAAVPYGLCILWFLAKTDYYYNYAKVLRNAEIKECWLEKDIYYRVIAESQNEAGRFVAVVPVNNSKLQYWIKSDNLIKGDRCQIGYDQEIKESRLYRTW